MRPLLTSWYEALAAAGFDPFWSAWSVGFCVVGIDGVVRITRAGECYLESIA